jgi:hypothetical protein
MHTSKTDRPAQAHTATCSTGATLKTDHTYQVRKAVRWCGVGILPRKRVDDGAITVAHRVLNRRRPVGARQLKGL